MSVGIAPKDSFGELAYEDETPQETADRLHLEHNGPIRPPTRGRPRPYVYQPFPACMYREWDESGRAKMERKLARDLGMDLNDRRQALMVDEAMPRFDSCVVEDESQQERRLADGWARNPDEVKAAKRQYEMNIAKAATERAYDDRHLGEKARTELDAVEAAAEDHVLDVPVPKKRGRKPKVQA